MAKRPVKKTKAAKRLPKARKSAKAAKKSAPRTKQTEFAAKHRISQAAVAKNPKIAKTEDGSVDVRRTQDIHDQVLRKERAAADLREMEIKRLRGELVNLSEAERYVATATKTVTDQLLSLSDRLAPMLASLTDPRQIRQLLADHMRQALENLPSVIRTATTRTTA